MAILETGYAPVTAIGTASSLIFNSGSVSAGSRDVVVINMGQSTVYVGGSVSVGGGQAGFPVAAGGQLTLQGPAVTLYANTLASTTSTVQAGLGTLVSVA